MAPPRSLLAQTVIPILTRQPVLAAPPRFFRRHHHTHTHTHLRRPLPSPAPLTPRHRHHHSTEPSAPRPYTFEEVRALTASPSPSRTIIIDVREPAEVRESGRIPGAYSMPLTSNPDAFHLSDGDFFDRFGFGKPHAYSGSTPTATSESPYSAEAKGREAGGGLGAEDGVEGAGADGEGGGGGEDGGGTGVEEVVFYCKAGVRSRAAARMAREWVGVKAGDMKGGWIEWEGRGGEVER